MKSFFNNQEYQWPSGYFGGYVTPALLLDPELPLGALLKRLFLAGSWETCLYVAIEVLKEMDEKHVTLCPCKELI